MGFLALLEPLIPYLGVGALSICVGQASVPTEKAKGDLWLLGAFAVGMIVTAAVMKKK